MQIVKDVRKEMHTKDSSSTYNFKIQTHILFIQNKVYNYLTNPSSLFINIYSQCLLILLSQGNQVEKVCGWKLI
jgi:hypothetical protein